MPDTRITFEEAREIVRGEGEALPPGRFVVEPYGRIDELFVHVVANELPLPVDDVVRLVNRETGEVFRVGYLEVREYLEEMDRVGEWPDD